MSNSKLGKKVIIYVKGNSFSVHVDNKKTYIVEKLEKMN